MAENRNLFMNAAVALCGRRFFNPEGLAAEQTLDMFQRAAYANTARLFSAGGKQLRWGLQGTVQELHQGDAGVGGQA